MLPNEHTYIQLLAGTVSGVKGYCIVPMGHIWNIKLHQIAIGHKNEMIQVCG